MDTYSIRLLLRFSQTIKLCSYHTGGYSLPKKMPILITLLVIGTLSLVLALILPIPKNIQWILLGVALLLNLTSAISLMILGVKRTRGTA